MVGHVLGEPEKKTENEQTFLINFFDLNYLSFILCAQVSFFCIFLTFASLLDRRSIINVDILGKIKKISKIAYFVLMQMFEMNPKVKLISTILFGMVLFNFLTKQIFLINVKTNKGKTKIKEFELIEFSSLIK